MESKALDQSRKTQCKDEEDLSNNSRVLLRRKIGWCVDLAGLNPNWEGLMCSSSDCCTLDLRRVAYILYIDWVREMGLYEEAESGS